MKIAYSKIILNGVIASTFLMVSCQKKGTVRVGVKAGNAAEKQIDTSLNDQNVDGLDLLNNPPTEQSDATIKDQEKDKTASNVETKNEAEELASDVIGDKKQNNSDQNVETKEGTSDESAVQDNVTMLPETVITGPALKECSEKVLAARENLNVSIAKFSDLYSKNANQATMLKSSEEILKLCKVWDTTFTQEQENIVCKIGQDTLVKKRIFDSNCFYVGNYMKKASGNENEYSLAHAKLQEASLKELTQKALILSKEAKSMLLQENLSWKAYVVDEQIQTDARKLVDEVKAKKVVCTFNAKAAQYGEADVVKMKVTKIQNMSEKNKTADVRVGADLLVDIISGDGASAKTTKETMTCANLNANYFNILDLKRALGSHFISE